MLELFKLAVLSCPSQQGPCYSQAFVAGSWVQSLEALSKA